MCCLVEIAILAIGLVTLIRGKLTLTRNKVVLGTPAHLVGCLLASTMPAVVVASFFFPMVDRALFGGVPNPGALYFWMEVLVVLGVVTVALSIAFVSAQRPEEITGNEAGKATQVPGPPIGAKKRS
jgi:putative exporter of polyketide antibiotics